MGEIQDYLEQLSELRRTYMDVKSLNIVNPFNKKIIELLPDDDMFIEVGALITKMNHHQLNVFARSC